MTIVFAFLRKMLKFINFHLRKFINKIFLFLEKRFIVIRRKFIRCILNVNHNLADFFNIPYTQHHRIHNKKHLLLDISTLMQKDLKTGIQRVVRSLLIELMHNPPYGYEVKAVFCRVDSKEFCYAHNFMHKKYGYEKKFEDSPIVVLKNDIFLGLDFNLHIIPAQQDALYNLKKQGVTIIFVVYDLLPLLKPEMFYQAACDAYIKWLYVILQFDGIICISQSVMHELKSWLQTNAIKNYPRKIHWFHLGADLEHSLPTTGRPYNAQKLLHLFKNNLMFLSVNTLEPRKGYMQLIAAFELLWQQGFAVILVIVGKKGWLADHIVEKIKKHHELNKRLFWMQKVSDEYLTDLYKVATCFIAGSEGEGFGLPLIEVAKYNVPIIARDLPVFKEIAQDNAYYFHGLSAEDLAIKIQEWLKLYAINTHPKTDSLSWMTWKNSAMQLKEALLME